MTLRNYQVLLLDPTVTPPKFTSLKIQLKQTNKKKTPGSCGELRGEPERYMEEGRSVNRSYSVLQSLCQEDFKYCELREISLYRTYSPLINNF